MEHPVHGRDARGVPSRYIRVELRLGLEQLAHVRHLRHVPVRHLGRPRGAAVRAVTATRHAGEIDGEAVVHRGLQRGAVGGKRAPCVDTELRDHLRRLWSRRRVQGAHTPFSTRSFSRHGLKTQAPGGPSVVFTVSSREARESQVSAPENIPVVSALSAKVQPVMSCRSSICRRTDRARPQPATRPNQACPRIQRRRTASSPGRDASTACPRSSTCPQTAPHPSTRPRWP